MGVLCRDAPLGSAPVWHGPGSLTYGSGMIDQAFCGLRVRLVSRGARRDPGTGPCRSVFSGAFSGAWLGVARTNRWDRPCDVSIDLPGFVRVSGSIGSSCRAGRCGPVGCSRRRCRRLRAAARWRVRSPAPSRSGALSRTTGPWLGRRLARSATMTNCSARTPCQGASRQSRLACRFSVARSGTVGAPASPMLMGNAPRSRASRTTARRGQSTTIIGICSTGGSGEGAHIAEGAGFRGAEEGRSERVNPQGCRFPFCAVLQLRAEGLIVPHRNGAWSSMRAEYRSRGGGWEVDVVQ